MWRKHTSKTQDDVWVSSKGETITHPEQIPNVVNDMINTLLERIENWQKKGGGYVLRDIHEGRMDYAPYRVNPAGSWIRVCPYIFHNRSIINQKNYDEECLKWASLVCLHHQDVKDHKYRISNYKKYENELNFDGISFPVEPRPSIIQKIEAMNPGYKWNVFSFNEQEYNLGHMDNAVEIIYTNKSTGANVKVINVMYYETEDGAHFLAIVGNLANIFPKFVPSNDGHKCHICPNCISYHTYDHSNIKNSVSRMSVNKLSCPLLKKTSTEESRTSKSSSQKRTRNEVSLLRMLIWKTFLFQSMRQVNQPTS
jgi:hypothetical protein